MLVGKKEITNNNKGKLSYIKLAILQIHKDGEGNGEILSKVHRRREDT